MLPASMRAANSAASLGGVLEERAAERHCAAESGGDDGQDDSGLGERLRKSHGVPLASIARSRLRLMVRTSDWPFSATASLDSRPAVDLYEYQGKQLFARAGIPVSEGRVATTPEEARAAAEELDGPVVVKAQVLVGGRGKAGGIKLADTPEEAEAHAAAILGMDIRGHVVRRLWIEKASDIAKEYYLSVTFDRGEKKPLFMLTTRGRRRHRGGRRGRTRTRSRDSTSTRSKASSPGRPAGWSTRPASTIPASRSRCSRSSRSSTGRSSSSTRCSAR